MLGLNGLARLVNKKLHAVELDQQIIRKLDVGFIDLIDQQYHLLLGSERLPELAPLDVLTNVFDFAITQLGVAQARDRVILVKTLLRLGRGLDVPLNQFFPESCSHLFGQHGLASARLTLDEQRSLQRYRGVHRHAQIIGRNITLCSFKLHMGVSRSGLFGGRADYPKSA